MCKGAVDDGDVTSVVDQCSHRSPLYLNIDARSDILARAINGCVHCGSSGAWFVRSGLSDHATVHHACWYTALTGLFHSYTPGGIAAKRQHVMEGQAHWKHRVDPAYVQQDEALPSKRASTGRHLPRSGDHAPIHTASPQEVGIQVTRSRMIR